MAGAKLTYKQAQVAVDELNSASSEMERLLGEITTLLNQVGTDEVWSGTAASTTKETFDSLINKFPDFIASVKGCSDYLMHVIENYKAVDAMIMTEK